VIITEIRRLFYTNYKTPTHGAPGLEKEAASGIVRPGAFRA